MDTVRILQEGEFPPEMRRVFQGTREWFKTDSMPTMSRVIAWSPEFQWGFGRATAADEGYLKALWGGVRFALPADPAGLTAAIDLHRSAISRRGGHTARPLRLSPSAVRTLDPTSEK